MFILFSEYYIYIVRNTIFTFNIYFIYLSFPLQPSSHHLSSLQHLAIIYIYYHRLPIISIILPLQPSLKHWRSAQIAIVRAKPPRLSRYTNVYACCTPGPMSCVGLNACTTASCTATAMSHYAIASEGWGESCFGELERICRVVQQRVVIEKVALVKVTQ